MNASRILLLIALSFTGCANLNTKNTVLRDMALGAAAGAILAQTKNNNKSAYTAMYAGVGAATTGAISAWLNIADEDQFKKENEKLKEEISKIEKQLKPQLVSQGKSLFSSPLPQEVSSLIEPGEWKRYKLDQWVQDPNQQNTWYRQIEMFEIIPPVSR